MVVSSGGSCRQAYCFGSGEVKAVPDEFREDRGFGGSREKFREGIAECGGDKLFGGGRCRPNELGDGGGEQALGDEAAWMWRWQACDL
jgi:hypothetical protein